MFDEGPVPRLENFVHFIYSDHIRVKARKVWRKFVRLRCLSQKRLCISGRLRSHTKLRCASRIGCWWWDNHRKQVLRNHWLKLRRYRTIKCCKLRSLRLVLFHKRKKWANAELFFWKHLPEALSSPSSRSRVGSFVLRLLEWETVFSANNLYFNDLCARIHILFFLSFWCRLLLLE